MLMPEEQPENTYLMVATGTGIAPFRSFLRRLFGEVKRFTPLPHVSNALLMRSHETGVIIVFVLRANCCLSVTSGNPRGQELQGPRLALPWRC